MAANGQNVKSYAGDDIIVKVSVTDEVGAILDLTGATFVYIVAGFEGGVAIITKTSGAGQIIVTTPTSGQLSINVGHTDTLGLLGTYWHQLVMSDASGNLSTITTGAITFAGRT